MESPTAQWSVEFSEFIDATLESAIEKVFGGENTALYGLGETASGERNPLQFAGDSDDSMRSAASAEIKRVGYSRFALVGAGTVEYEDEEEEAVLILYAQGPGDATVRQFVCGVELQPDEDSEDEDSVSIAISDWHEMDTLQESWIVSN